MKTNRVGAFAHAARALLAVGMALPSSHAGAQSADRSITQGITQHMAQNTITPAAPGAAPSQPPKPPPPCSAPEYRQFDFWIGHWDVFQPDGKRAGENLIEPILGGCALRETWQGNGGFAGTSLNAYDPTRRLWHQTWLDNQGGRLDLSGGLRGAAMVLESHEPHPDKPGVTLDQRIAWSVQPDASVRQLWETSEDGGKTWSVAFDGKYVRRR
jgi:hypothetical protein